MNESRLSQEFFELSDYVKDKSVSLNDLRQRVGLKAHALLIVLLCFPFMLPIPIPGLSVIFGAFVILSAVGLTFDIPIRLPDFIGEKKISGQLLKSIFKKCGEYMSKAERLIHPRGTVICDNHIFKTFSGLLVIISAIVLSLPMPPGFNFPPAIVCVLISLGLLEKDIVLIALGYVAFVAQWIIYVMLFDWLSRELQNLIVTYWPF